MSVHAQRRLAAILAADVVGYSRMIRADEEGTLSALKVLRAEVVDPKLKKYRGRIVKLTGDGMLVEFASVVDAVRAAIEAQQAVADRNAGLPEDKRIEFRVGINLGDVVIDSDDIYGDGVNVAARLEGLADPGSICISGAVHDQVKNRMQVVFEDLGNREVKNIDEPVRVWRWSRHASKGPSPLSATRAARSLPDKPSIAVLPFDNMSGDPEQEYFADGLVEEIITGLSKMPTLFVIARNSTFTYKGKAVDVREVARELGVRYVLEGSVRKAANRVRITGQLVEGTDGTHVWADKFEGPIEDIFALQDRLTESIVGAIEPSVRRAEIEPARSKRPDRLDAYDLFLQAMPHAYANSPDGREEALRILSQALQLDPNYAAAHAFAAWCHEQRFFRGGFHEEDKAAALKHASMAISLGADDPQALSIGGFVRGIVAHDYETAIGALNRALEMNGNSALAYGFSAQVHVQAGHYDTAIDHAERALRLSPRDPFNYHAYMALAFSYFLTGRFEEGVANSKLAIQSNPGLSPSHAMLVANLVSLGRLDEARAAGCRLLEVAPDASASSFVRAAWTRPDLMEAFGAALRKAGLPE